MVHLCSVGVEVGGPTSKIVPLHTVDTYILSLSLSLRPFSLHCALSVCLSPVSFLLLHIASHPLL